MKCPRENCSGYMVWDHKEGAWYCLMCNRWFDELEELGGIYIGC